MSQLAMDHPRDSVPPLDLGVSLESRRLAENYCSSMVDYRSAASRLEPTMRERFQQLSREWKRATRYFSSSSHLVAHPAYLRIIALGPDVVPLILRNLEHEPAHWFPALVALTNVDPVAEDDWGNVEAMARTWVEWGRTQNLL